MKKEIANLEQFNVECKRILPKWNELKAYNEELDSYLRKNIEKYAGMVNYFKRHGPNQSGEYKENEKVKRWPAGILI